MKGKVCRQRLGVKALDVTVLIWSSSDFVRMSTYLISETIMNVSYVGKNDSLAHVKRKLFPTKGDTVTS